MVIFYKNICKLLKHNMLILIIVLFISGLIFIKPANYEGFDSKEQCPNILIQKGGRMVLYNSKLAKIPGVNPIEFDNLEDYSEYINWSRSQGNNCPVLFLQQSYDTQGNSIYKNRKSPMELEGGTPPISGINLTPTSNKSLLFDAGHNDPPYNKNMYPSFDPLNQYIGLDTPIDNIYHQNKNGVSPSAMDSNWGGTGYTAKLITEGKYKEDNVSIYVDS